MSIEHSLNVMRTMLLDRPLVVETMATLLVLVFLLIILPYYVICGCRRRPNGRWARIGPLRVERVRKGARLPTRPTKGSLGYDIYASCGGTIVEGTGMYVPTGLRMSIPGGHAGFVYVNQLDGTDSHSRPFAFTRVDQVIYPDSQTELLIVVANRTKASHRVRQGDVIAHLIIQPVSAPAIVEGRLEGLAYGGITYAIEQIKRLHGWSLALGTSVYARLAHKSPQVTNALTAAVPSSPKTDTSATMSMTSTPSSIPGPSSNVVGLTTTGTEDDM